MIKYAHAIGNWSTMNWYDAAINGNIVSTPGDGDIADLNGYAITMDIATIPASGTLLALRSPSKTGYLIVSLDAGAGLGNLAINAASITAGTRNGGFIAVSGTTYTLTINAGQITAGSASGAIAIDNTQAAHIIIVCANLWGGGGISSAYGLRNSSTGQIDITGNVRGGAGSNNFGLYNMSSGAININGNVLGSEYDKSAVGVFNNASGIITITGNLIYGTLSCPYNGYRPVLTLGSQYYYQMGSANIKFPQQLATSKVLKGTQHGDTIGTLSPDSPFRRLPLIT
ncbi:MAG: hypothetical protein WC496_02825 [Phycisphaerae bacterium]|jgi:hypothetical protein